MTFPCCSCALKVGCRIFASFDIFLSIMSFFQWLNMFMESSRLKGDEWEPFIPTALSLRTAIEMNCEPGYYQLYTPTDLGLQLMKAAVFFSLSSVGYFIAALFMIYATISAPDTAKVLLTVFAFCQFILVSMSMAASIMFNDSSLCFYGFDGLPGHHNRQVTFLVVTIIFVFGYKLYELVVVIYYMRELNRVTPEDDDHPEIGKMCPASLRAVHLVTPKPSKTNALEFDLNMNIETIDTEPQEETHEEQEATTKVGTVLVVVAPTTTTPTGIDNKSTTKVVIDENQNLSNIIGITNPDEFTSLGIPVFYSPYACARSAEYD